MDLVFNDERLMDAPGLDSQIQNEHRHRYLAAARLAKGKRVLDAACGSGYGSALLAESAAQVVGIDKSRAVIDYCLGTYQKENLSFLPMAATELAFPDGSFDLAVSFETIEHLKQEEQDVFLRQLSRVLTKNGTLIISSPNRALWERTVNGQKNKYHLHELSCQEFKALVSRHFQYVTFYYQNYQPVSLITDAAGQGPLQTLHSGNFDGLADACYFIAVCSDRPQDRALTGVYLQQTSQAAVEKQLGFVEMDLYCDCGSGFTEADKLRAPARFAENGRYEVTFTLTKDAAFLRFDPGEAPCTLWNIRCDQRDVSLRPINGTELTDHAITFSGSDPILLLEGRDHWNSGLRLTICFGYLRGTPATLHQELEQLYAISTARNSELAKQYLHLQQQQERILAQNALLGQRHLQLEQKYADLSASHKYEQQRAGALSSQLARTQASLDGVLSSHSWRVTKPLRKLLAWLRGRK